LCVRHQLTCCSRCSLYDTPAPRPNAIKPQTARVVRARTRASNAARGRFRRPHSAYSAWYSDRYPNPLYRCLYPTVTYPNPLYRGGVRLRVHFLYNYRLWVGVSLSEIHGILTYFDVYVSLYTDYSITHLLRRRHVNMYLCDHSTAIGFDARRKQFCRRTTNYR
jgi:hypothetical protein